MIRSVVVVDYGIGNVFSVCNALKKIGAKPVLTRDFAAIRNADRVILPGVGAFGRAMDALRKYGLDEALLGYVGTGRPFLGICLGMQMLMDGSLEFGEHRGLGFVAGRVERIPATTPQGAPLRVPHVSWAKVEKSASMSATDWQLSGMEGGSGKTGCYYFVHSFMAMPADGQHLLAQAEYGGNLVTAAVKQDNITGVQFHPERSGPAGLSLLGRLIA
jgi:glutamine amidotransferase